MAATRAREAVQQGRTPSVSRVLVDDTEPGLIARWRHTETGWEGLVATIGGSDGFIARWLPAARITPTALT